MRIIPAIDLIDGKCVRLTEGKYDTKRIYSSNPLEMAQKFEDVGIQYLHLVDLDGAKNGSITNTKVLETIASRTKLKIDFGGGLRTDEDVRIAFESGATQITGGSIAIRNPKTFEDWLKTYGTDKIILGADCRNRKVATDGWLSESNIDVLEFIQNFQAKGVSSVICTDISKDGMLAGPSIGLYREIIAETRVNVIASGGVSNINDLEQLKTIGCEAAIVGKALYENKITLKQLEKLC